MFDWIPLIGEWSLAVQAFCILVVSFVSLICWSVFIASRGDNGDSLIENTGVAAALLSLLSGTVATCALVVAGVAAVIPDSNAPEPISVSSVSFDDRDYDRKSITIRCPESRNTGEVELLGQMNPTSFRVEAIRIRAGGDQSDLTVDAGVMIYERQIYRSPTPRVTISGFRADGQWQSRFLDTTLVLARGEIFLMNAGLGTAKIRREPLLGGIPGFGPKSVIRDIEQQCEGLMISF